MLVYSKATRKNENAIYKTTLAETDDVLFNHLMAINVKGTFNPLRIAAKRLRTGGRIVNFSSSVKTLDFAGYSIYATTKAAVESMTNIFPEGTDLRRKRIWNTFKLLILQPVNERFVR